MVNDLRAAFVSLTPEQRRHVLKQIHRLVLTVPTGGTVQIQSQKQSKLCQNSIERIPV